MKNTYRRIDNPNLIRSLFRDVYEMSIFYNEIECVTQKNELYFISDDIKNRHVNTVPVTKNSKTFLTAKNMKYRTNPHG